MRALHNSPFRSTTYANLRLVEGCPEEVTAVHADLESGAAEAMSSPVDVGAAVGCPSGE